MIMDIPCCTSDELPPGRQNLPLAVLLSLALEGMGVHLEPGLRCLALGDHGGQSKRERKAESAGRPSLHQETEQISTCFESQVALLGALQTLSSDKPIYPTPLYVSISPIIDGARHSPKLTSKFLPLPF
jgi:hypothetical protein